MVVTHKEPLLFSRVTYGCMILSAVGLLTTVVYGMRDPMLRVFAEVLRGWIMIAMVALWARIAARWLGAMDAKIAQIENAAQPH